MRLCHNIVKKALFFEQRKELIDSECLKYLQENTNMELLET